MKKFTCFFFAFAIAMFSISAIGCGAGSAKDASGNPDIEKKALENANKKRDQMDPQK